MYEIDEDKYYENYFDVFHKEGWKQFVEEQRQALEEIKSGAFNGNEENFYFYKGQVDILSKMINFADMIEAVYEQEQTRIPEHDSLSI